MFMIRIKYRITSFLHRCTILRCCNKYISIIFVQQLVADLMPEIVSSIKNHSEISFRRNVVLTLHSQRSLLSLNLTSDRQALKLTYRTMWEACRYIEIRVKIVLYLIFKFRYVKTNWEFEKKSTEFYYNVAIFVQLNFLLWVTSKLYLIIDLNKLFLVHLVIDHEKFNCFFITTYLSL